METPRVGIVAALALAAAAAGCTNTSTAVTAPSAAKCEVSAGQAPGTFDASGGSGAIAITAARDCTWSVATTVTWVTITGDRSGQGDASVPFAVAANPAPAMRNGAISIGSNNVPLSQAGAPCRFSINRSGDTIGMGGGRLSVDVTTLTGCSWTATVNAGWLSILSGASGNASATVSLSVAANGDAPRVGQLNVGGQIYTVNQDGTTPPPPTPTPPPTTPPPPTPPPPSKPPTPTPPPPPQRVSFSGTVSSVSGGCPSLSMTVSGRAVTTDGGTKFKGIKCNDIRPGVNLSIDGTLVGSAVNADTVSGGKGDDH